VNCRFGGWVWEASHVHWIDRGFALFQRYREVEIPLGNLTMTTIRRLLEMNEVNWVWSLQLDMVWR
jgi:hypothetical protein